jgi:excisionase family DNA binding protein
VPDPTRAAFRAGARADAARLAPPAHLLTVTDVAEQLGLSRWTISRWITRGLLPAQRFGRRRWVRLADAQAAQAVMHAGSVVPAWRRAPLRAGWRLRQIREAAQWTQLELAARSGLTHEAISKLERGRRSPHASTVRALAQALGVAPTQFVLGTATDPGLTTAEAAARLRVPPGRVQQWLLTGRLAGWKVSGQWRVATQSVAALAASDRLRGRSRRLDPRFRG